ncbi:hypothetical protein HK16_08395 [Acetobacter senegalensis]|uniref:Inosine/uridine-preferring nucleoside hydrolase domain-containing protein n=2 Tax=Acetobacter TaxID=434 RepID=A0A252EJM5_9PROT|nr:MULTISPECIES: nucleoside hydrolase [Acetobacter]ATJ90219.1 nucleoside hydrolase [Acetobacter tropicalis]MCG4260642.1 nucleoside hydrolase [Acetobacter senegalensis]OUL66678.1 hypothetical protein HK16_08395 [Acetobacter senegalensis]
MTKSQQISAVRSLIIDTDPGHDDAFALFLALASPNINILGISAISGNIPVMASAENARRVVEIAGFPEMEVRPGAVMPLMRAARYAHDIHGKTGIDGYDWPMPANPPLSEDSIDWMIRTLLTHPAKSVTLLALGPLTNVALMLRRSPAAASRVRNIVMMGGGFFEGGNVSPAAEFNILVDPEAAAVVFTAGVPLTVMPIDCTQSALMPVDWKDRLAALGTRTGDACAGMISFFEQHGNRKFGTRTRPLHDALAMAWILWPELFSGKDCYVAIETGSTLTLGMTVVDWWGSTGLPANCHWVRSCAVEKIYELMFDSLAKLP